MKPKFYPPGPSSVPSNLTTPNKAYKKNMWIATGALVLFILVYLSLTGWFFYKSIKLFMNLLNGGNEGFLSFLVATIMALLGVFMVKGLFFIIRRDETKSIQITAESEPELFAFIYQIADEVKAPRPHKVFVSDAVNACVFYDVSIVNLFFPSKKNLEIGLGLVNTLNLGEFKSILAHEFGHFAQKSMIIGRWVYIAQQVAHQIVAKRDVFDSFINGLSRFDLRVAWVGWILSIIVWSLRSVSETFFKLVIYTQRALSREMEFHADLVSVSVAGSDALIHSLYKLNAADDAYENALEFANSQLKNGKAVEDIFSIQSNYIQQLSVVLNNPAYGASPHIPNGDGATFKVFKEQLAQAPKMWSTHPSNIDREKNTKRVYVPSPVDERSSWIVFADPESLKIKVTASLYTDVKEKTTILTQEDAIKEHNKEFEHVFLQPQYKGVYLYRMVTVPFKKVEDMLVVPGEEKAGGLQFSHLYPDSIKEILEQLKDLEEEVAMLEGLNKKELDANEGRINYRGRELKRSELPIAINEAKTDVNLVKSKVVAHDQLCRALSYQAAKNAGPDWENYYVSVLRLVHYCEHSQENIGDLSRYFYETLNVVSMIKGFGNGHLAPLYPAGNQLSEAMSKVYSQVQGMKLSDAIKDKTNGVYFKSLFNKFELGTVYEDNLVNWINVVQGWVQATLNGLNELRIAALDELLLLESKLQKSTSSGMLLGTAPEPIQMTNQYDVFDENSPRIVTKKPDLLSKFYHGDGFVPTISRLAVAASIVLFAVFFSMGIAKSKVYVYNGFDELIYVDLGNKSIELGPHESEQVEIDNGGRVNIRSTTEKGDVIEEFEAPVSSTSSTYIYNIAGAAVIYKWFAVYGPLGNLGNDDFQLLGTERWMEQHANYYFEEPPETISAESGSSTTKEIISAFTGHPVEQVSLVTDPETFSKFITAHAVWETSSSSHILTWMSYASTLPTFGEIISKRLERDPMEVVSLRFQQDLYTGSLKDDICEKQNQMYLKDQNNPDLYYLKCRCMPDGPEQDNAFREGTKKWPNNGWLAYASGYSYTLSEDWADAMACYTKSSELLPYLAEVNVYELRRIAQLLDQPLPDNAIVNKVPYIDYLNQIENSAENDYTNKLYAYKLLSQGKITEAVLYCESDTTVYPCIIRLAAVSDGASRELIKDALALPLMQGLTSETIIPAMALLAREGEDLDVYKEDLKIFVGEGYEPLIKFMDAVQSNKIDEADKFLLEMHAEVKSKACLFGVLILGNRAPEKWNRYASKLLFINEKPYWERAI